MPRHLSFRMKLAYWHRSPSTAAQSCIKWTRLPVSSAFLGSVTLTFSFPIRNRHAVKGVKHVQSSVTCGTVWSSLAWRIGSDYAPIAYSQLVAQDDLKEENAINFPRTTHTSIIVLIGVDWHLEYHKSLEMFIHNVSFKSFQPDTDTYKRQQYIFNV